MRIVRSLCAPLVVVALGATAHAQPAPDPQPSVETTATGEAEATSELGDDDWHRWHLELAIFPVFTEQQIEGPNRDDKLTTDSGISTSLNFSYAPLKWIEPVLWLQLDAGKVRRALYTLPDEQGEATEAQLVEGSYWEMWLAFLLRGRFSYGFAEAGWAPLILRGDSVRRDLANTDGETEGTFEGSRAVAWMFGLGASVPVAENFDLTARFQFRIRYLVSRGGKDLANDEETGQMAYWPYIGAHAHW